MSTELSTTQGHSVQDIEVMAKRVAQSKLFGIDEAQAFTLMLLAQADGIHPIHAMRRYHVVKGRPTMKADAMLADMMKRGWIIKWLTSPTDVQRQAAIFTHTTKCQHGQEVAFSIEDAKRADLLGSDMYRKYPSNMLRARMISVACRMLDPDVVAGIYTPEEAAEMQPIPVSATIEHPSDSHHAKHHDNGTGHGSGAYADPESTKAFQMWCKDWCEDINGKWLDHLTDPNTGEIKAGPGEIVNPFQLAGHIVKWARASGLINAPEDYRAGQRDKFAAVVWMRNNGAMMDECRAYCRHLWREAKGKVEARQSDEAAEDAILDAIAAKGDAREGVPNA